MIHTVISLDEVVKEMKGVKIEKETEIQIDLKATSYIPDKYIDDSNLKIEIYQNIALCKNEEDIQNVTDEIIDRFGNIPKEVENLLQIARIKYLGKALKIEKIASTKTGVVFTFETKSEEGKLDIDIVKLVEKYGSRVKFSPGIKQRITLDVKDAKEKELLKEVIDFLKGVSNADNNK